MMDHDCTVPVDKHDSVKNITSPSGSLGSEFKRSKYKFCNKQEYAVCSLDCMTGKLKMAEIKSDEW